MPLVKTRPRPSSRIGLAYTCLGIEGLNVIECGSMGHTLYLYKEAYLKAIEVKCHFYSSHLNEHDLVLGMDQRLIKALEELKSKEVGEKVVALMPSSLGEITGFDLKGLAQSGIEGQFKLVTFEKGGFDYSFEAGLEEGLFSLCKALVKNSEQVSKKDTKIVVNVLGGRHFEHILDLDALSTEISEKYDCNINTFLPLSCSVSAIEKLTDADLNIVISKDAIKAAEFLKYEHQLDYIVDETVGGRDESQ